MDTATPKAIVAGYFDRLLNRRDLSVCDELLSPDYRDHDAPPDVPPGPNSTKQFVAGFLAAYPDLRVAIDEIIAEDQTVAARLIWRGTHKESGEPLHQLGIVLIHLDATGRLLERWSAYTPIQ